MITNALIDGTKSAPTVAFIASVDGTTVVPVTNPRQDTAITSIIERLKKEVEHLRQAYHRVKDENERLALDLGIKNKDFYDQR